MRKVGVFICHCGINIAGSVDVEKVAAGMNPYLLECANIREQCSWVHQNDRARATDKALCTIQSMVEKVKRNEALDPLSLPLTKKAMVIGGGSAGVNAALVIADYGCQHTLY